MSDTLTVLGIATSLRKGSLNAALLEAMVQRTPPGLDLKVHADLHSIPLFNQDLEGGGGPEGVQRLRRAVADAHALIIVTPEYNQSIPGVTKNIVDWLSRGELQVLAGKPLAIAGATPGPWGTRLAQSVLRHTLTACGSLVMPTPQVYVRSANEVFDAGHTLRDERTDASLRKFLQAFADWIRRVSG